MNSTTLPLPRGAGVVRLDRATGTLRERKYQAEVIDGPDRGASVVLQGTVRVGTHSEAELRLTDPTASRYHLELDARDCGVLVRDLKSTNGTYLSGARVEQVLLERSSTLKVGQTTLRVSVAESDLGAPREAPSFHDAVGASAAMRRLFGLLTAVSNSDATVVLLGETGTGKEVLARSIHKASPRSARPFMVVDCSALPAGLAESELFGHLRGAFTGAVENRLGAFLEADGGTLFLDEIGELPLDLQPKLLRVLETGMVKRVGENHPRRADVRIVAATHRDLEAEVAAGRFRADLFYRLSVVLARVPPLRDRLEDLPRLVRHLSAAIAPDVEWPASVLQAWARHSWPGNVRELRNAVQRALVLRAAGHSLEEMEAPPGASLSLAAAGAASAPPGTSLSVGQQSEGTPDDAERRRIAEALASCAGNQTAAAKLLGISRRTLVTRLSTLGLPRPRKPQKPENT